MCGIWALFGFDGEIPSKMSEAWKISHRGPDSFRFEILHSFKKALLGFHHLAIVGSPLGMQPIRLTKYPDVVLMFNGEIYNYKELNKTFDFKSESDSDGECIVHLYKKGGIEYAASMLDGVFAFCLVDVEKMKVYLGRDTIGVKPLYKFYEDGKMGASSEYKALVGLKDVKDREKHISCILPATVESFELNKDESITFVSTVKYRNFENEPRWTEFTSHIKPTDDIMFNIRALLTEAVRKRLMTHRRIGCLLSGGLDSSLIAGLVVKCAREEGLKYPIQTFSCGLEGSPDLEAAKQVADFLGTEHHEIIFSPNDGTDILAKVIYHVESSDSKVVPNSIAQYLLCKHIRTKTDTIVVMSGEGADEIAQGYGFFHQSPSIQMSNKKSHTLLEEMHMYAVLRTEKMSSAHGLEIRVPFLDHHFIHYYLSIAPELRCPKDGVEKYLLRKAFDGYNVIPSEILWRKKAEFGEGAGTKTMTWYEHVDNFAETQVIGDKWKEEAEKFNKFKDHASPTKAEYHYQRLYNKQFKNCDHLLAPQWSMDWVD